MVALIRSIAFKRKTAREWGAEADTDVAQLKQWLQLEGRNELVDGEHNLRAWIHDREGWEQDLRGMPQAVLLELQEKGLLRFDNTAYEALRKAAPSVRLDEAAMFRRKVITSTALEVKALKEE